MHITREKSKRASKGITDVLITTSNGSGGNQDRKKKRNISAKQLYIVCPRQNES